jgi:hypothetical protein
LFTLVNAWPELSSFAGQYSAGANTGTNVEFDQTLAPRDGDGMLMRRADGEVHSRLYRDTFDGHFEAVALDARTFGFVCVAGTKPG